MKVHGNSYTGALISNNKHTWKKHKSAFMTKKIELRAHVVNL